MGTGMSTPAVEISCSSDRPEVGKVERSSREEKESMSVAYDMGICGVLMLKTPKLAGVFIE
jgi:hypothetical protein